MPATGPVAAVRFLCRIPVPGPDTRAEDLPLALPWFPVVGALLSAAVAGLFLALRHGLGLPDLAAAVAAVAAGLLLTGGFHEDACGDSADGLGGGRDRAHALEIMKDSRIGAFGAMAIWAVLSFRVAALVGIAAVPERPWWMLLAAFACAGALGRWTSTPLMAMLPPARADGLAHDLGQERQRLPLAAATLAALAVAAGAALAGWWFTALGAVLLAALVAFLWGVHLARRLGGQTGDTLGAATQLAEAAALLAFLRT